MKKVNFIKMVLDIFMAIVFVLLFNKMAIVPMTFHEIAGLVIGGIFIIHIAFNFKWVKQVTLKLFSSKVNLRTKFGYMIDVLLLICFIVIIISGILISHVLFPNLKINSSINFRAIHISISYIVLLLVGIHIGLHWNWAMNVFKKVFRITEKKRIFGFIAKLAVVLLFVFGSYNVYSAKYFSKVASVTTSFSGNSQHSMGSEGMNKANGEHSMQGSSWSEEHQNSNNAEQSAQDGNSSIAGKPSWKNNQTSSNVFEIISMYGSIIAAFSIITFYLEKLLVRRKITG